MKEQGTKITENIPPPLLCVIEVEQVRGILVYGKVQGGTGLWLQQEQDCQRVHLNFHVPPKEFVALTTLDG